MMTVGPVTRFVMAATFLLVGGIAATHGQSAPDRLYHAYYLEHAKADFAGAAKLYGEVAAAKDAAADMQATAKVRLVVCQEELATSDLARLMPPAPLAYFEINQPGERVRKLLGQLGLLAQSDQPAVVPGQNRLAISPALVDAFLGMRGAAIAITGFDVSSQRPAGVGVFHPGNMEVVRGLIETALPATANVVQPIGGFPTYEIEGVYVTLTARLVLVGSSALEIEGVLDRMKNPGDDSLATDPQLADALKDRRGELMFFCMNPQPLLPMLDMMMRAGASQNRQVAMAQALLDLKSLRALTGRLDLSDEGLTLELALQLDEGHRNLVYNFLRRPAIDKQTLRCVPAGAAGLLTLAMNDAPAKYADLTPAGSNELPIVTALDIGREMFANINGVVVYALPPIAGGEAGSPMPDLAAAITVNDPTKSQALWSELLGLASLAAGAPTMDGESREIAGTPVRSYDFDGKVTIHVAVTGHYLLIASTESALTRSLDAQRSGKSIVDDPGFAPLMSRIGPHTTFAVLAHAGRCAEMARPFVPPAESAKFEPVIGLLANTFAAVTVDHSNRVLRLSMAVTGVPDVSGLVNKMLTDERQRQRTDQDVAKAIRQGKWDQATTLIDRQLKENPDNASALRQKFDVLAAHGQDKDAALAVADKLLEGMQDDAQSLNNLAWALLTEEEYGGRFNDLALRLSRRANELTNRAQWAYLDTLALAEFKTGSIQKAIEIEQKAIELSKTKADGAGIEDMQEALQRFRDASPNEAEAASAQLN